MNNRGPTAPPDWHLTIWDLIEEMKAGKRTSLQEPELTWAREYEQSLIPGGVRFPQKGDVYESLKDQTVGYLTHWLAPFTLGGEAILLKGERVWINSDPFDEKPIGTGALALEYQKLEARMVPKEDRENQKYAGFSFSFKTMELINNFKLVATGYTNKSGKGSAPDVDKQRQ